MAVIGVAPTAPVVEVATTAVVEVVHAGVLEAAGGVQFTAGNAYVG